MVILGNYCNYFEDENGSCMFYIIDFVKFSFVSYNFVLIIVFALIIMIVDGLFIGLFVFGVEKVLVIVEKEKLVVFLIFKKGDNFEI